jgi:hypothetical protein
MRRIAIYLIVSALTFIVGVSSSMVWNNSQGVGDALVDFVANWQD